jgi:hypothetical protein
MTMQPVAIKPTPTAQLTAIRAIAAGDIPALSDAVSSPIRIGEKDV